MLSSKINANQISMARKPGKGWLALALALSLNACGDGRTEGPAIYSFVVTGTDGQPSSDGAPASISPIENLGQFSIDYSVENLDNLDVQIHVTKDGRVGGNSERLKECCDEGCAQQHYSCVYAASSAVSCNITANTLLADYFQRTGGLPSDGYLLIKVCSNTCSSDGFDFDFFDGQLCNSKTTRVRFQ